MLGVVLETGESIGIEPPELLDLIVDALAALIVLSPAWLVFVFAAYVIGRKQLALRDFLLFVTIEAAALWLAIYVYSLP
jgi:hypothetical protein